MEASLHQENHSMLKELSIICVSFVLLLQSPAKADPLQDEVVLSLQQGAEAWNRGDLEAFMKGYVEGQELTYTAAGKVVRGYEALQKRYQDSYGKRKDGMGKLTFSGIETWPLGTEHALAMGQWMVDFGPRTPAVKGIFSLVLRRGPQGWLILHDHTSKLEESKN